MLLVLISNILRVINAYLSNTAQVTKVSSFYSEILDLIFVVPQGPILGSLLFSVNIIDLNRAVQNRFFKLCRWHHSVHIFESHITLRNNLR